MKASISLIVLGSMFFATPRIRAQESAKAAPNPQFTGGCKRLNHFSAGDSVSLISSGEDEKAARFFSLHQPITIVNLDNHYSVWIAIVSNTQGETLDIRADRLQRSDLSEGDQVQLAASADGISSDQLDDVLQFFAHDTPIVISDLIWERMDGLVHGKSHGNRPFLVATVQNVRGKTLFIGVDWLRRINPLCGM